MNTAIILGVIVVIVVAVLLHKPLLWVMRLVLNSAVGLLLLFLANSFIPQYSVGLNPFTVLTSGFLGIPGIGLLYILKIIL